MYRERSTAGIGPWLATARRLLGRPLGLRREWLEWAYDHGYTPAEIAAEAESDLESSGSHEPQRRLVGRGRKRDMVTSGTKIQVAGQDITIREGRYVFDRRTIDTAAPGDYGCDPLGDGRFRMVPSGDIVDYEERTRRLASKQRRVGKRWTSKVTKASRYHPPAGLFTKDAETIARRITRDSSTIKQAIARVTFYENRAGSNLTAARRRVLEQAKDLIRTHAAPAKAKASKGRARRVGRGRAIRDRRGRVVHVGDTVRFEDMRLGRKVSGVVTSLRIAPSTGYGQSWEESGHVAGIRVPGDDVPYVKHEGELELVSRTARAVGKGPPAGTRLASFLDALEQLGGITRAEAEHALAYYRKHKLITIDGHGVRPKHGSYLDRSAIREAARLGAKLGPSRRR